ncbi:unnamed protein product [Ostreobium quekettii]|uniref:Uncharacterized protein n=1 Tax=Ostreobium quekettii TaxID=121088 RepID=A0A8S1J3E2_9CHLO|nr:unnamed protein product [Ostreobium quekettii]
MVAGGVGEEGQQDGGEGGRDDMIDFIVGTVPQWVPCRWLGPRPLLQARPCVCSLARRCKSRQASPYAAINKAPHVGRRGAGRVAGCPQSVHSSVGVRLGRTTSVRVCVVEYNRPGVVCPGKVP